MMAKDSPFGNLMAEAVKLKGAQQAQLRPLWDSWPQYFQHSMFMTEPIVSFREKSFDERIEAANEIKTKGNDFFMEKQYEEAVGQYEMALAIFKYCENTDPGWKKKGIHDDDIKVIHTTPDNEQDAKQLTTLMVSLYLNISVCKMRLNEFPIAIAACNDAIKIDPTCSKAYFRRSQALITPLSSGATEFENALHDLEFALKYDPDNLEIRKLYRRLREEEIKQRKLDKATFSGMFDRGSIVPNEELIKPTEEDTVKARSKQIQQELEDAQAVVRMYEAKGDLKSAKDLQDKIDEAKAAVTRKPSYVDFYNPSPEMIQDGKKNGIDLTDVRVQKMLADLQDEHLTKGTTPTTKPRLRSIFFQYCGFNPISLADLSSHEAALLEADEILPTLSNEDIASLLKAEGMDVYSMTQDKEEIKEIVRNVVANKLSELPRQNQAKESKTNTMKPVLCIMVVWILCRLYSSGSLTMLYSTLYSLLPGQERGEFDGFDEF
ncbi:hypothetical protein THRCLA_01972 [Thraustotheca clavata]|uniref:Uncharacterized protein n=1 Tax=Thraustotheca clavata TaxID=74557 RepID=A0A1W0A6P0_9STRA|nr:hypothetical protein THRCLA_01972 [Thraustotheca clavata]